MARTINIPTAYTRKLTQTTLGLVVALGLVAGLSQAVSAQQAEVVKPQEIFQDQQDSNPFSGRSGNQGSSVLDLVHRAIQAGSLSSEDFQSQQQENLDSATADFRAAQQKRLGSSQTIPAIAPTVPVKQ